MTHYLKFFFFTLILVIFTGCSSETSLYTPLDDFQEPLEKEDKELDDQAEADAIQDEQDDFEAQLKKDNKELDDKIEAKEIRDEQDEFEKQLEKDNKELDDQIEAKEGLKK